MLDFYLQIDCRPYIYYKTAMGQGKGRPMKVDYLERLVLPSSATVGDLIQAAKQTYFRNSSEEDEFLLVDRKGLRMHIAYHEQLRQLGKDALVKKTLGVIWKRKGK